MAGFTREGRWGGGRDGVGERGSYYERLDNLGQQFPVCSEGSWASLRSFQGVPKVKQYNNINLIILSLLWRAHFQACLMLSLEIKFF